MRLPGRVLCPCGTCLGLTPGSVQASRLLLFLFSFGIQSHALCSQHSTSHFAAGLLFSGPPEGWPLWLGPGSPSGELSLQTPGCCPGCHPTLPSALRGPSCRLSHRENPDFVFLEQESVGPSTPQFPSIKPAGLAGCFPKGSKEGLAAAQCLSSLKMGSPAHSGI